MYCKTLRSTVENVFSGRPNNKELEHFPSKTIENLGLFQGVIQVFLQYNTEHEVFKGKILQMLCKLMSVGYDDFLLMNWMFTKQRSKRIVEWYLTKYYKINSQILYHKRLK